MQPCGRIGAGMDPSRKRAIRLVVALTAALLLASALVYTSFAAGRDELTASQLLQKAKPGKSYILAGTVLAGSVRHQGYFECVTPSKSCPCPSATRAWCPIPSERGGACWSPCASRARNGSASKTR